MQNYTYEKGCTIPKGCETEVLRNIKSRLFGAKNTNTC